MFAGCIKHERSFHTKIIEDISDLKLTRSQLSHYVVQSYDRSKMVMEAVYSMDHGVLCRQSAKNDF